MCLSSQNALACKSTFYPHESTYFTTCLDCLLCSRLGKAEKAAPRCQKSALCLSPVSPAFCRTSGSLSYLPRRTKIDPDRAHLGSIWALSGSPVLSWGLLGHRSATPVSFAGLPWALLPSPGSTWGVDLRFSSARSGTPGLDLNLLGSIWGPWARSGAPVLDLEPLGSIWSHWARSGAPGLDLEPLGSI